MKAHAVAASIACNGDVAMLEQVRIGASLAKATPLPASTSREFTRSRARIGRKAACKRCLQTFGARLSRGARPYRRTTTGNIVNPQICCRPDEARHHLSGPHSSRAGIQPRNHPHLALGLNHHPAPTQFRAPIPRSRHPNPEPAPQGFRQTKVLQGRLA